MKSTPEPIVETRAIETRGGTLVIEMTQSFVDRVRSHFNVNPGAPLADDHLKMYVWGAVNSAVTKAAAGQPAQQ